MALCINYKEERGIESCKLSFDIYRCEIINYNLLVVVISFDQQLTSNQLLIVVTILII